MRRRLAWGLVAATLLTLAVAGGCGVPSDDSPQAIPRADLPGDLLDPNPGSSTTLPESAGTTTVGVYLLEETANEVRLVLVDREVTESGVPNERLTTLFGGATQAEIDAGITSAIPVDTKLLDVTTDRENREVTVDISGDIFTIEGELQAQAFAQMVWTATEPTAGGYRQVRFLVDGKPTTVLDGDGVEQEVLTRSDYSALSPS